MPIKKIILHPLTILTILCLGIGVYKIAVLGCVSNDSVTFMQFSEDLKTAPGEAIKSRDQHPGYPAIILISEWVLGKLGYDQTLGQRIIAAQAATLICRTIAVCFLYSLFRFFGNKRTALVTAVLVMLIPVYANNGSEVLSDWPSLMLMAIALFFCLRGLRSANYLYFLTAGAASGLAYWIRPEGAVFVAVLGLYTLFHTFGSKNRLGLWTCFVTMIIAAGLIAGPYMSYKGALFPKKKVGAFSHYIPIDSSCIPTKDIGQHPLQAGLPGTYISVKPAKAILHFVEELFNTIFLFSIPLLGALLFKAKRFGRLNPQDQFLILFTGLWLALMVWLHCKHGYMSHRHIMPLVVFGFAWIVKGLHGLALAFGSKRHNLHRNTAVAIGVCVAIFVPKLIRPAHADKAAYREAGLWLRDNTPADATLAVFDSRIGFYAERSFKPFSRNSSFKPDYAVIKASDESTALPETATLVTTGKAGTDNIIRIYRLGP